MLVAKIFNQLNNSIWIWKPASKHLHFVPLLHWTHLYIVAMFSLWCSSQVTTKFLYGAHRRGRTETSLVIESSDWGWLQLPGANGQGLGLLLMWRSQISQVTCHGVCSSSHCLLVHGGAGVWDDTFECLRNPPCRGNLPVQKAWQMKKGRRAHRAFCSQVPCWSMQQTIADVDAAIWLCNHLCGSEQSYTGWHIADIMKQSNQSILVKPLHANTNTLNGN